MAVHMAISGLSAGMGVALLIYDTVVAAPPSITMYPVEIISSPLFLIKGAETTCCPISRSALRPEISDKYNRASASLLICEGLPGNKRMGMEQEVLIW